MSVYPRPLLLPVLFALAAVGASAQVRIEVSTNVLRHAAELQPLGVNNMGDGGSTRHAAGNLITNPGFEPIRMRDLHRVLDSGETNGHHWATLDGNGTSKWHLYTRGTYSGARMRAYRFVDGAGQPLPYGDAHWAQGGKILDARNGTDCVLLFDSRVLPRGTEGFPDGGWLTDTNTTAVWDALSKEQQEAAMQDWRVYYEADVPLRMDDVVIFERSFIWPEAGDFHPRTTERGISSEWNDIVGYSRQVPAPADVPAGMDAGQGVMEMNPTNGEAQVWQKNFGGTAREDASWYGTLEPGVTYRYEAWARTAGAATGEFLLGFANIFTNDRESSYRRGYFGHTNLMQTFPVDATWQRVGFSFVAPGKPTNDIEGVLLRYTGEGKLLVDNVKLQQVYEPGDEDQAFVINHTLFKTLLDSQPARGRKGAARQWCALNQGSMASDCDWAPENRLHLSTQIGINPQTEITLPKLLTILEATGDSPETRMVPWLNTQVTHDEEEYRQLLEYLVAPYDPAVDTPASKPMAWKRVQQRGHNRPWIEDFREFIVEFGNENWHNRAMENWIGFSRAGAIHQGGREYGLWGKYMIGEMKKSPYWDRRITICFGGNYTAGTNQDGSVYGYGQEATVAAGGANDDHSHATYIGPRWEVGEACETHIDDQGVQRTLFAYRLTTEMEWERQADAHRRLREMGFDVRMSAYEGGPSGFGLRAKNKDEDRAAEYYGKSLAMGTAIFDAWLDAWAKGWTYQCYLGFQQGRWWSSHTSLSQGHRPSPGWLAEILINRHLANQDLLELSVSNAPLRRVELKEHGGKTLVRDLALVQAHALGGAGRVAVALANLDLQNEHEVDLRLPMAKATRITWYTLKGDPRDTNLEEEKVTLSEQGVPPSELKDGRFLARLPAGRPAVAVFEE